MAKQDNSTKTFVGGRISSKQYKLWLSAETRPEARRAIKNFVLGEPLKYYAKNVEADTDAAGKIDELLSK